MAPMPAPPSPAAPPIDRGRRMLSMLFADSASVDLRFVGRTLLHAALVGVFTGVVAVVFFGGLELVENVLLSQLAGYRRLRASGEGVFGHLPEGEVVRLWLLPVIPALGALAGGILTARLAPEAAGGGGDAMIRAFHQGGGFIRKRVAVVKAIASILTLGSGGAGGREGPTMQVGGAVGSLVARALRVGRRERRILLVAGVAGGMSAIFRTPLGAALLATEVLYRDDFEGDALIPALLASVVSYSVFISVYGESTLFAHSPRYPFIPSHLLLYALLALFISVLAIAFLKLLGSVKALSARSRLPVWARPGVGGLALGLFCVPILWFVGRKIAEPGHGIGILGSGYGAVQVAITGASWLPGGWTGVELLLLLCAGKMIGASLTLGSGGSAGDFAPSLVIGGLLGGAFGRAAALLLHDPRIDPGAFALVGMGTFYGGIAHAPLSSLVMVCELAGSYDLLVPLMLAEGIAFVALRRQSLYHAQVPTKHDSPAHAAPSLDVLKSIPVSALMVRGRPVVSFLRKTTAREMLRYAAETRWQDVFPVLDEQARMVGMITADSLRIIASERELELMTVAADLMQAPLALAPDDDLRTAVELMVANGVREAPVLDEDGVLVGFIDEADAGRAYLEATKRLPLPADATPLAHP
jgi:chloride channel protein, CIC family